MSRGAALRFPEGFLWGAATSAHQTEGGNVASDWWELEHRPGTRVAEPSGDACDSYHRYREDLDIVRSLGLGAYRFSVEWARIEPHPGEWSQAALDHYRRMSDACLERSIVPVVTYHHFTLPRWVAADGGWTAPDVVGRFADYAERLAAAFGETVGWVCTINEVNLVAGAVATRHRMSPEEADRVVEILLTAHEEGSAAVKAVNAHAKVGMTLALPHLQAVEGGEEQLAHLQERSQDRYLRRAEVDDFVGVQTYTRDLVSDAGTIPPPDGAERTQTGWEWYPQALQATVRHAWEVSGQTPVLVTENGIATSDDDSRIRYTRQALSGLHEAITDGVGALGYLHWSLLDNFEWWFGYRPTFGLVEVDRRTFARSIKASGHWLGQVAAANALPAESS